MNRLYTTIISMFIGVFSLMAQTSISISSSGSLKDKLPYDTRKEITNIKISGPLNAEDIAVLKNMAKADSGKLAIVDLSATELIAIGDEAFSECTNLTKVVLPSSVSQIGNSAFGGCKNLTDINIPDKVNLLGNYAFAECEKIKSITIPQTIINIPNGCFADCHSLESINLPLKTQKIGKEAFARCQELKKIEIPAEVNGIGGAAFAGCLKLAFIKVDPNNKKYCSTAGGVLYSKDGKYVLQYPAGKEGDTYTIPEGVIRVGSYSFSGSKNIKKITIPKSCTSIGYGSFYECSNLSSIELPESIQKIEEDVFYGCCNLETLHIPNEVAKIGVNAFFGCTKLKNINIPQKLNILGKKAFMGCASIEQITLPEGVTTIPHSCFSMCTNLKTVTLPNSTTEIEDMAFGGDSSLQTINLPENITTIGNGAFAQCANLKSIALPNSLKIIGFASFFNCTNIESISIPMSVDSVGTSSFANCDNLREIKISNANPPKSNILMSYHLSDIIKLSVPEGSEEKYHNALGWKEFRNINKKTYEIERAEEDDADDNQLTLGNGSLTEEYFLIFSSIAKETETIELEDNTIYKQNEVEEPASFSNGQNSLDTYLKDNIRYPKHAKGRQGVVGISFVVEKNGSLSHFKVEQSQGNELDAEAVSVVYSMPKWNAAKKGNKTVRSEYQVKLNIHK